MEKTLKKEAQYNVEAVVEALYLFGTLTSLAKALQVNLSTVHNWINLKSVPSSRNCLKIEKATNGAVKAKDIRPDYEWAKLS